MIKNKSTINERIAHVIDNKCDSNRKKFAEAIGFAPQVINNIVSGRKSKPSFDVLNAIKTSFVDINSNWLLTGDGEMLKQEKEITVRTLRTDTLETQQSVPYYNLTATASVLEAFTSNTSEVPLDHISIPNLPKCDGALNITGDSMYPLLKSGDIVMYRNVNDLNNIIWGEMYLMYLNCFGDEFFFCKYIHKSDKEGYVKLVSQNKHHEPKEFPIDCIKQLAIVKASIRMNSVV